MAQGPGRKKDARNMTVSRITSSELTQGWSVPASRKLDRQANRFAWLNKDLLVKVKHRKEVCGAGSREKKSERDTEASSKHTEASSKHAEIGLRRTYISPGAMTGKRCQRQKETSFST